MKIVIGLLGLILVTLLLGPIAGIIAALCAACLFIPVVGNIAALGMLFGGITYFFGKEAIPIAILLMLAALLGLYVYSKKTLKKVISKKTAPKVNIKSGTVHAQSSNVTFSTVEIQETNLVADNVSYPLSSIDITWANDSLRIFNQGKILGTSEKTRDEYKALNREMSKQRKIELA